MSDSMMIWMLLWKVCLIGALLLFSGMAIWVTIGGALDIRRLFARLGESSEQGKDRAAEE